ncbi:hypothetical protein M8C21_000047, partial [Ambrosia artemisiifolia]
ADERLLSPAQQLRALADRRREWEWWKSMMTMVVVTDDAGDGDSFGRCRFRQEMVVRQMNRNSDRRHRQLRNEVAGYMKTERHVVATLMWFSPLYWL